jgi:YggT family protein
MVEALWGAVSFFLGFLIIILVLRFIAYLAKQSTANHFWRVIDMISQPVVFRINRYIFKGGIMSYGTSIALSLAVLIGANIILSIVVSLVTRILAGLPI